MSTKNTVLIFEDQSSAKIVTVGIQGPRGIQGETGATGAQGEQGEQGERGDEGSQWFTGNGAPDSNVSGVLNDMYLDLLTYDIYQYDSNGWGASIGNIQGADGENTGVDGGTVD